MVGTVINAAARGARPTAQVDTDNEALLPAVATAQPARQAARARAFGEDKPASETLASEVDEVRHIDRSI